jgi:recombination protein RecT
MTAETVTSALAKKDDDTGPRALVDTYRGDYAAVLPSHLRADTWVRLAQGALKKGKKVRHPQTGKQVPELELAASNNPAAFLAALLEAARLGLEPGTEQFYLTPRKEKGVLQVQGIVGYQGYIELMYRAGAISSVVAEVVRTNDMFSYRPGRDEIPNHDIDWDSEDRGDLRLVYCYAVMKGGGYSKVVVLNRAQIRDIKAKAQGANTEYSPWATNPESMWLKSAVRQLRKWVPTSAEFVRSQLRVQQEVAAEGQAPLTFAPHVEEGLPDVTHLGDGEVIDAELVDRSDEVAALEAEGNSK